MMKSPEIIASVRSQIRLAPEHRVWVIINNNVNPVVWDNARTIRDNILDDVRLAITDNVWQAWTDE